jgi:hypothetical protein
MSVIFPSSNYLLLINGNTRNLNLLLLSKPNENKNTHKPKSRKPHKNPIFKAKEKNTQKEEACSTKIKKYTIYAHKEHWRSKLGEIEDFTLNYIRWLWLHFVGVKSLTKMLAGRKVVAGSVMAAVFDLSGTPNDGEISFSFS